MALVEEHKAAMLGEMGCQHVLDARQLLVGDQHEAGITRQRPFDLLTTAAQSGEPAGEVGHALTDLLIPRGEGVLRGDH